MSGKSGFFSRLGVGLFWDIVLFVVVMLVAALFGLTSLGSAYSLTIGILIVIGAGFYVYRRRASVKNGTQIEKNVSPVGSASKEGH